VFFRTILPRDAMHSADYAVARCPFVRLSVTCRYRNGQTYQKFIAKYDNSDNAFCHFCSL